MSPYICKACKNYTLKIILKRRRLLNCICDRLQQTTYLRRLYYLWMKQLLQERVPSINIMSIFRLWRTSMVRDHVLSENYFFYQCLGHHCCEIPYWTYTLHVFPFQRKDILDNPTASSVGTSQRSFWKLQFRCATLCISRTTELLHIFSMTFANTGT